MNETMQMVVTGVIVAVCVVYVLRRFFFKPRPRATAGRDGASVPSACGGGCGGCSAGKQGGGGGCH